MTNPFDAPQEGGPPPSSAPGTFTIGRAFEQGLDAFQRNWVTYVVGILLYGLAGLLSFVACILPALFVVPVLAWGFTRYTLDTLDGQPDLGVIFSGFSKVGEAFVPMLGVLVLLFLAMLPGQIGSLVLQFAPMAATEDALVLSLASLVGSLFSTAWSVVVMSRFFPAMYLLVDQGLGPVDAMTEALQLTSGVWGTAMGMYVIVGVVLPLVGFVACFVGIVPASCLGAAALASATRQLQGRA